MQPVPHKKHWLMGHTLAFAKAPLSFVLECMKSGPGPYRGRIAFRDFVIATDVDTVNHVLQKKHKNYKKSFVYDNLKYFLGNGLLTSEGEVWLKNRRILQPHFIHKAIAPLENRVTEIVQDKIDGIQNGPHELQGLFMEWTRDILLSALFDLRKEEIPDAQRLNEQLWRLRNFANNRMTNPFKLPLWIPTKENRALNGAVKDLEGMITDILRSSKDKDAPLIAVMLDQVKTNNWTDQQLFDEIVTLFIAGQETTTNALVFALYLLTRHPEYVSKVQDESDPLQWEHIISETLRLYPPAWAVSREAVADDLIEQGTIPKGSTVFISIYAMQRHPDVWDEPEAFKPERFIGDYPKHAFLPFGIGPRMCIGNHFAELEMKLILQGLYNNFEIQSKTKELIIETPITMGPKEEFYVDFNRK